MIPEKDCPVCGAVDTVTEFHEPRTAENGVVYDTRMRQCSECEGEFLRGEDLDYNVANVRAALGQQ